MSTDLTPRASPRLTPKPTPTVGWPGAVSTNQDVEPSPSIAFAGTPTAGARRYGSETDAALAPRSIATGADGAGVDEEPVEVCDPPPPLEGAGGVAGVGVGVGLGVAGGVV